MRRLAGRRGAQCVNAMGNRGAALFAARPRHAARGVCGAEGCPLCTERLGAAVAGAAPRRFVTTFGAARRPRPVWQLPAERSAILAGGTLSAQARKLPKSAPLARQRCARPGVDRGFGYLCVRSGSPPMLCWTENFDCGPRFASFAFARGPTRHRVKPCRAASDSAGPANSMRTVTRVAAGREKPSP